MRSKDIKKQLEINNQRKQDDFVNRQEKCLSEIDGLLKKYDLALASQAALSPDGRIVSRPIFIDGEVIREREKMQQENKNNIISE